jgi:CTP synthase
MTKYIFITGGVVSGIGKGVTAASIGNIIKASGHTVDIIKYDPYLNVDPGTMSPFEHGEVYVLDDGTEADLDLGHYERFLDTNLTKQSSYTAGRIYSEILAKERRGDYLGRNVQMIPEVSDYIQSTFQRNMKTDFRIIEIGGSSGDIEAELFLESLRQFRMNSENVYHIHLGYVPYLKCSHEYKTKPIQNSFKELAQRGLMPDIVVVRYAKEEGKQINRKTLDKIALFARILPSRVVTISDVDDIYDIPQYLINKNFHKELSTVLGVVINPDLTKLYHNPILTSLSAKKIAPKKILIIGKYSRLNDTYLSIIESIKLASCHAQIPVTVEIIEAEDFENPQHDSWDILQKSDAVIIPGGFGTRGLGGMVQVIEYVRLNQKPFLGICLGMQMTVVEYARNVCKMNAFSIEMLEESGSEDVDIVINKMPTQLEIINKGGSMRLGGYDCTIEKGTLAYSLFKKTNIRERHRHRLEVQPEYVDEITKAGLVISGKFYDQSKEKRYLVEIVELPRAVHKYFIATQSHPEFLSRIHKPHPLFLGLIQSTVI